MNHRIGEVKDVSDGRDSHFGFSILDVHNAPIVTFSYLDRAEAVKARGLVELAIAGAVAIRGVR